MSAPASPVSGGPDKTEAATAATGASPQLSPGLAPISGGGSFPARLHLAPKAAAQSEVSAEVATGTVGTWPQQPATASPAQPQPQPQPQSDSEALFEAVHRGDLDRARRLFEEKGLSVSMLDGRGNSLLHISILGGSMDMIRYLVEEKQANVNLCSKEFDAPPLFWAISNQRPDIIVYLTAHGADTTPQDSNGNTVLHAAVHSGSAAVLALLLGTRLAVPGSSVDQTDIHDMTPLMWAAYQSKEDILRLLMRVGANVNAQDKTGKSSLHYAMMNGYPVIKVALLAKGADFNLKDFGSDSDHNGAQSPRDVAVLHGYLPEFEAYIREAEGIRDCTDPGFTVFGRSLRKEIGAAVLPLLGVVLALGTMSLYPWFIGVPLGVLVVAAMHYAIIRVVIRRRVPPQLQRLPYVSSVFQSSALVIFATWVTRVLPVTTRGSFDGHPMPTYRLLNVVFMWLFGSCMYFFYTTVFADPGYIHRNENIQDAVLVMRRLAKAGCLDPENFCFTCLNKRPLRSKHCKFTDRCVARFDHHCPWAYNVVGVGNHREFVSFLALLAAGIATYVVLVSRYMESMFVVYDPIPGRPCLLSNYACGMFQADSWVVVSTVWITFNAIWVTFLLANQLYLIAVGCTTNEMLTGFVRLAGRRGKGRGHGHNHAHGKRGGVIRQAATRLRTLILGLSGSAAEDDQAVSMPQAAAVPQAGTGARPPSISHSNSDVSDELLPQNQGGGQSAFALRSMGYSRLLSDANAEKLKSDPYSFGLVNNCLGFWTRDARGRLAGTDWRQAMDITELAPYRPPSAPQLEGLSEPAHVSVA
ncbi:palmitoyltransferase akr1, partial [Coemansia biformis]